MRAIALCLLTMTIAASAAPPTDAPELEKLRASYKAAVAKGTKSVLQSHIANLEKLRDIYTRGSNLTGAAKVQGDIDRANVAMATGDFLPPAAESNNAPAPELDKLRAGKDAEIARALKPYQETYVRELDKLRDNYTRAANLAGATAVQEELDDVREPNGPEPFFVGKSWYTPVDSEFHFNKDGSGARTDKAGIKTDFTWKKLDSGLIEVSGRSSPLSAPTKWYFKFDNRRTGSMGDKATALISPTRPHR